MHVLSADDLTRVFSAHAVIFQAAGNKNEEPNANTEAYLVEQQVKYWWSNRNSVCVFTDCVWGAAVQAGDPVRWSLKEGHSLRATIDQNRHSGNGRRKSLRVNMEEGCFTMSLQVERQQKYRGQFSKGFTREKVMCNVPYTDNGKGPSTFVSSLKDAGSRWTTNSSAAGCDKHRCSEQGWVWKAAQE